MEMKMNLHGRVALITGSSRGLGKTIAIALAKEGTEIIINGRYGISAGSTASDIERTFDVPVYQLTSDATNSDKILELFREKMSIISRLDILVNNVGNIEKFGRFEDLEDEDWLRMYDLGCMSAVRFIRAALPFLKKSNQARIINIASLSAHQPSGLNPHYGMAKAGILNLTKNLAQDFGKYGILVNSICPSTLAGGGWHQNIINRASRQKITLNEAEKLMRAEETAKSPLGKMGELEDVANLVVFLASANANFLTGHCYNVDGGITRSV